MSTVDWAVSDIITADWLITCRTRGQVERPTFGDLSSPDKSGASDRTERWPKEQLQGSGFLFIHDSEQDLVPEC